MLISIAPVFSLTILYNGIQFYVNYFNIDLSFDVRYMGIILWAIYFLHLFVHHKSRYNFIIMFMLVIMAFMTSAIAASTLILYAFVQQQLYFYDIIASYSVPFYLGVYVILGPLVVSILLSGKGHSFLFMLKSIIYYYAFLPMFIAWFSSYSYARLFDLGWGNRAIGDVHYTSEAQRKATMTKFRDTTRVIIIIMALINLIIFFLPIETQLYLMCTFFVLAAYQLTLSIVFCLVKIFYKIGYLCVKLKYVCKKIFCIKDEPLHLI